MLILGIDPGLERIGYGLILREGSRLTPIKYGLIQTPRISLPERLALAHQQVSEILDEHKPDCLATEKLFFTKNQTTAFDVAKSLGCVLLAAANRDLDFAEYSPPQIKKTVVGTGTADKKQVQFMVTKLLSLQETPKPDDVADALAIAITHALYAPPKLR